MGGYIIRNWKTEFIQVSAFNMGTSSILVVEATKIRNGINAAVQAGYTDIHIEGDNKILIQVVQGYIQAPWEL